MSEELVSDTAGSALPSLGVVDPADWTTAVAAIQAQTGVLPSCDLSTVTGFVARCIAALVDADTAADPGALRGLFSDAVVGQLTRFGGQFARRSVPGATIEVLGARPAATPPVVRLRVDIASVAPSGDHERHDGFWDVQLEPAPVVVGATQCAGCGATLAHGCFVCPYCHADTRATADVPLLVVRLERLS